MVSAAEREQKGKGENSNYIHVPAQHVHVQPDVHRTLYMYVSRNQGNIQEDSSCKLPRNRLKYKTARFLGQCSILHCTCTCFNERRKEERSKQGQTNKQGKATQHTQGSHFS